MLGFGFRACGVFRFSGFRRFGLVGSLGFRAYVEPHVRSRGSLSKEHRGCSIV